MKTSNVKQAATELTVGFFVFAILGALIMITIVLSYDNMFAKNFRMSVLFDNVTGLTRGDKVYVQGVDVGRVKTMSISEKGVMVDLTLKYQVNLREDYVIQVKPSSILGGKYIEISEGTRTLPLADLTQTIVGRAPIDFIAEAADAVQSVRASLEDGGVLANLEDTMENLKKITDDIQAGQGTVGKLIKDETVYNDLRDIAANLKEVSGRLERGEGTLGKLLSKDDTIYKDLEKTVATLNDVISKVNTGEGTLGKLINDDSLHSEIMKTLAEVRSMIDDIRETSPVTSLTSVFFGAF